MTTPGIHQTPDANFYRRRSFLKFMGLSPLVLSLLERRSAFAAAVPGVGSLGIDVHYHVFNASDLPESLVFSGQQRRNFFRLNAARFLGLKSGSQARARLEAYHQKYTLDPAWLAAFDAAL